MVSYLVASVSLFQVLRVAHAQINYYYTCLGLPSFNVDKAKGSLNSPFIYRDKGDVEEEHSLFCPPSEAGVGVFHKVRM